MFDAVAGHYDRANAVLSAGNDRLWRVATTRAVDPQPGERILDLAAGTGTSSAALAAGGASVVAADFSPGMIAVGRARLAGNPRVSFVQADAMDLPFQDGEFDATTISFGLRNVERPELALSEMFRVTRPGGRIVICEFSRPPAALVRVPYLRYLRSVLPRLASLVNGNAGAYEYLAESIEQWPDQLTLASWLRRAGYREVRYRNLSLGVVALHRGFKPAQGAEAPGEPGSEAEAAPSRTRSEGQTHDEAEAVA